jgi:integrase
MCILLDQGRRVSEVALIKWKAIDAINERLTFYRPKVHKVQTLRIFRDTRQALTRYRQLVGFYERLLLSASSKSGRLLEGGMTQVQSTVGALGALCGLSGLSARLLALFGLLCSRAKLRQSEPYRTPAAGVRQRCRSAMQRAPGLPMTARRWLDER